MTWTRSTVSTFGIRYSLPIPDLTADQSIEALVEGSEMSLLREGKPHVLYLFLDQFEPLKSRLNY